MSKLPTVLLHHLTPTGSHYDWLIDDPTALGASGGHEEERLWTGRVTCDSTQWAERGSWDVEQIAAHRRHYLTYQGPIGGGRGSVTRVDEGLITPHLWTADRIVFDLVMRHCAGRIDMARLSATLWRAHLRTV